MMMDDRMMKCWWNDDDEDDDDDDGYVKQILQNQNAKTHIDVKHDSG